MKPTARKILHVVGARPNFMKLAPLWRALSDYDHIEQKILHTGQHYDTRMSSDIFKDLRIPRPHILLRTPRRISTSRQLTSYIRECTRHMRILRPHLVVVYGDTNSTLAAALAAKRLGIRLAHIEAGLRSNDLAMPEERNRIMVDHISDYYFTTSPEARDNLDYEGIDSRHIYHVGNIMIDSLHIALAISEQKSLKKPRRNLKKNPHPYALVTLHRPSNVDEPKQLKQLLKTLKKVAKKIPVLFPVHPRTAALSRSFNIDLGTPFNGIIHPGTINVTPPLSYIDFVSLYRSATLVMTDSGGIQEETSALGIPCLTLRETTERPITERLGTNVVVGTSPKAIMTHVNAVLAGRHKKGRPIPYWDGKAGKRIADKIVRILSSNNP